MRRPRRIAVMVDFGLVQTLLAIPGALEALRSLSSKYSTSDADNALKRIAEIENSLSNFSRTALWFREAKELHENLTQLDQGIEDLVFVAALPYGEGGFNPDKLNMEKMIITWRAVRNSFIIKLLTFFQDVKIINEEPLVLDEDSRPISGPDYMLRFAKLKYDIDSLFSIYSPGDSDKKKMVCDLVEKLHDHTKAQVLSADRMIITMAFEMSECLLVLNTKINSK